MSKSYKKTPKAGWINTRAQKLFRSKENRRKRRKTKVVLKTSNYLEIPHEKTYGNEWSSPRDGKWYFKFYDWAQELMRK